MMTTAARIGFVTAVWRYPVKSMQGENLTAVTVTSQGLLGDRAYALVDAADGSVVSAKNPRRWPQMFALRATFAAEPKSGNPLPPVRIRLPQGQEILSTQVDVNAVLSQEQGRPVTLQSQAPGKPILQQFHPDLNHQGEPEKVTDEPMLGGTFFDLGIVHLVTTATLERLAEHYPQGQFAVPRFRPNLVVTPADDTKGFIENDWVGRTLRIGSAVRLHITQPCSRCVMTTLPQDELPRDLGILRTAVQANQGNVGIYATVVQPGDLRVGDDCWLE
jgi:uncharacterized protein YcbX